MKPSKNRDFAFFMFGATTLFTVNHLMGVTGNKASVSSQAQEDKEICIVLNNDEQILAKAGKLDKQDMQAAFDAAVKQYKERGTGQVNLRPSRVGNITSPSMEP